MYGCVRKKKGEMLIPTRIHSRKDGTIFKQEKPVLNREAFQGRPRAARHRKSVGLWEPSSIILPYRGLMNSPA